MDFVLSVFHQVVIERKWNIHFKTEIPSLHVFKQETAKDGMAGLQSGNKF